MAKAKVEPVENAPINYKEELQKTISKKYGDCLFDGSYLKNNPKILIPTTPTLDISLKGGIPEGCWTVISGKPKTGKSSMALQIAANAQKLGRHVYYLDVEHRFDIKNLTTVTSLITTPDMFTLVQSTKEKILSAQDFLNMACDIVSNHPKCVLILDSISSLCSENETSKEVGEMARPEGPKMLAQFCRKNAAIIPINGITFIGIIHLITNSSGYGPQYMEDSGVKMQYQISCKLLCKSSTVWEEGNGEDKRRIGSIVEWNIAVAPNGPPGDTVKTYLRFGYGFDSIWEIIALGIEFGLISKKGAWFEYLPDETNPESLIKTQGQTKLYNYFVENETELNKLHSKVKEMVL